MGTTKQRMGCGASVPADESAGSDRSPSLPDAVRTASVPAGEPAGSDRSLSLPAAVRSAGSIAKWNAAKPENDALCLLIAGAQKSTTVDDALTDLRGIMSLEHNLWAYMYLRQLYDTNLDCFYGCLLAEPALLMPVVYTPTVGEACQKFGLMPFYPRGCYISITDRGNIKAVLQDYAKSLLKKDADGTYGCDCIVFSDGGRILGLGDLGAWGMGIPIGKLDLYTACAGINPHRTMPVIIDAGISDALGNTAKLDLRGNPRYLGLKQDRKREKSSDFGTVVNTAYYGSNNVIEEFMEAACEVFGRNVLLQFEDFNSNDAFPLLDIHRNKYCTYNDDIQGTAAITCAGILGSIKIKNPDSTELIGLLPQERVLFHGAGSANLGAAALLHQGGMPLENIAMTNSRGLMWKSDDEQGTFRNEEQKVFAVPKPAWPHEQLEDIVANFKPSVLVGATGRTPGAFTEEIMRAMVRINSPHRPVVFALSNPKTQAEVNSTDAYTWTEGKVIFGSGTKFNPVTTVDGVEHHPGMVNNVYIFPGLSFGAVQCGASTISDAVFLKAAEAVGNTLTPQDIREDRVVPPVARIRSVALKVATAVVGQVMKEQKATKPIDGTEAEIAATLEQNMWTPSGFTPAEPMSCEDANGRPRKMSCCLGEDAKCRPSGWFAGTEVPPLPHDAGWFGGTEMTTLLFPEREKNLSN